MDRWRNDIWNHFIKVVVSPHRFTPFTWPHICTCNHITGPGIYCQYTRCWWCVPILVAVCQLSSYWVPFKCISCCYQLLYYMYKWKLKVCKVVLCLAFFGSEVCMVFSIKLFDVKFCQSHLLSVKATCTARLSIELELTNTILPVHLWVMRLRFNLSVKENDARELT